MSSDISILDRHFPDLTAQQRERFASFVGLIEEWNAKINLISRSDVANLPLRHVLHSLAIAKVCAFKDGTSALDVGTGGGFPGIPLAILFPECRFHLIDSIGKKIKVVQDCIDRLGLQNATAAQARAETVDRQFDFVVARAVTQLPVFVSWVRGKVKKSGFNDLENGILYLKGGDLAEEFSGIDQTPTVHPIPEFFDYPEFAEKYVIHLPRPF